MTENKKIFATPKVRKFARELGANVSQIEGTERKGRITEGDVKNFVSNKLKKSKNMEVDNQSSEKIKNEYNHLWSRESRFYNSQAINRAKPFNYCNRPI